VTASAAFIGSTDVHGTGNRIALDAIAAPDGA
jgi:hypothetical protein